MGIEHREVASKPGSRIGNEYFEGGIPFEKPASIAGRHGGLAIRTSELGSDDSGALRWLWLRDFDFGAAFIQGQQDIGLFLFFFDELA